MKHRRTIFLVIASCILFSLSLSAQDFYWDTPITVSPTNVESRFPSAVRGGESTVVFWQEIDTKNRQIWLSCQQYKRFAGPFSYSGEVPTIYSATACTDGSIYVAVLSDINTITILRSQKGNPFVPCYTFVQNAPIVAPRIYTLTDNTLLLFTALGQNETFSILNATSQDGTTWTDFTNFTPTTGMTNVFLPVVGRSSTGDCVVFQSQYIVNNRYSYQLFLSKQLPDKSWSTPVLLTAAFTAFNNQQPFLYEYNGTVYITWERTDTSSDNSHICVGVLNADKTQLQSVNEVTTIGSANRPVLFEYQGILSLTWCDNRTGTYTAYFAQQNGLTWMEQAISKHSADVLFVIPVKQSDTDLQFVWQIAPVKKQKYAAIQCLAKDSSAPMPNVSGVHFNNGQSGKAAKVAVQLSFPYDAAGIAGYSWTWTKNPKEEPGYQIQGTDDAARFTLSADTDGTWYFKARVMDYAGNWSDSATISYIRDTVAPQAPILQPVATDAYGFAVSNTPTVSWQPPQTDTDIVGYTWSFTYKTGLENAFASYKHHAVQASAQAIAKKLQEAQVIADTARITPPQRMMGTKTSADSGDKHNGIYIFTVAAIDAAGNIGESVQIPLVLNKFEPHTVVTHVKTQTTEYGERFFDIIGDGFLYDGTITNIYIDADGQAPYDIVLPQTQVPYTVASNTLINHIAIPDTVSPGAYYVGIQHSQFGIHFSSQALLSVIQTGTIKIGEDVPYTLHWITQQVNNSTVLPISDITIILFIFFLLFGCGGCIWGLVSTVQDSLRIQSTVTALLEGGTMPKAQKAVLSASYKKKGTGLKVKLLSFTIVLVLTIVLLIAVPLQMIMISSQEKTLTTGLKNRVDVLLNGMAIGGRSYLPDKNIFELSFLPSQTSVLSDARYATITGFDMQDTNVSLTHVWATNDPDIASKIDTDGLLFGQSKIQDAVIEEIAQRCMALNAKADEQLATISAEIAELTSESESLYAKQDEASRARLQEIQEITTTLNEKVTAILTFIADEGTAAYPSFDTKHLDTHNTEYVFYRPILYRQRNSQTYVHGIVSIAVTTENLVQEVAQEKKTLLITTFIIALFGIGIGIIGSLIVATIIVTPIRRLVAHVAMIGETRDKEKLVGKDIVITSHDEIGELGETVNEMTHGLIKAAQEEHLLIDGKVVQQTFLPLNVAGNGAKETTSKLEEKGIECFGYYEGASSVSGDYYDYKKLDTRWFVTIKCDVSGHGVPAALIMTVVATLFRKYFENWSFAKKGTRINELVVQINDFIESLGLKGKFATIILCLVDMDTGTVYACNAGDNIVHIYDSAQQKEKTIHLFETPAAGPLPSFVVDLKGGFKVEKLHLNKGDVLFLYTDGIEESTRKFRNSAYEVVPCAEPGKQEGEVHENHKVGQTTEQLEADRIQAIIEAVYAKQTYVLKKYHSPDPSEQLVFDFTNCDGTIEEVILALISIEKVFRLYKDPLATENDTVRVDKKIDAFLQKHFNRYDVYCSDKDVPAEGAYLFYKNIKEDEQLDDLTLVALRRP